MEESCSKEGWFFIFLFSVYLKKFSLIICGCVLQSLFFFEKLIVVQ
jgi:hypothetical protein